MDTNMTFRIDSQVKAQMAAICEQLGLPVVIHTGDYRYDYSHPRRLVNILRTFPDLVVDAAHFGCWSRFDSGSARSGLGCSTAAMPRPSPVLMKAVVDGG